MGGKLQDHPTQNVIFKNLIFESNNSMHVSTFDNLTKHFKYNPYFSVTLDIQKKLATLTLLSKSCNL